MIENNILNDIKTSAFWKNVRENKFLQILLGCESIKYYIAKIIKNI